MKTKVLLFLQFLDKTLNDLRTCNIPFSFILLKCRDKFQSEKTGTPYISVQVSL